MELASEATELEGLVVIGYGEKASVNLTESVGTVSEEEIQRVPIATAEQAIQGRVSGVQVQSESGLPGAPVAVRIRGVGTIGNTQPLFVIDGVPVGRGQAATSSPLATINPADIESISVLKDASAAAVYGVQAANGVVLIQTKRGTLGKPTIRYDGYYGVQGFPQTYDVLNSQQYFDLAQESFDNFNEEFGYEPGDNSFRRLPQFLAENQADLVNRNLDWFDVIAVENAPINNHNVAVSGATEQVNYYVSAGYFQQNAILERWDLTRLSFRANSDFQINDRVRFGETFSLSNGHTFRGAQNGFNGQLLVNTLRLPPFFNFRDTEGTVAGNRYGFTGNREFAAAGLTIGNEPALNLITENNDRSTRVLGGLFGEVDLVEGLTFRSSGNVDYQVNRDNRYNPDYTAVEIGLDRGSTAVEARYDSYGLVWTNTLNYTTSLGEHNFDALAGVEAQKYSSTFTQIETTNFLVPDPNFVAVVPQGGELLGPPVGFAAERGFLGYIGRLNYNYADRYLLTATVRRDGASTFAPENRWSTFPAFSAGWRVSQEPFFNVPWVSELKLRGSWGQLGNSEVPGAEYPHLFRVTTVPDYGLNGETVVAAPAPVGFVNPNLVWETSETTDFGFESTLFDNVLDLAATYYRKDTEDFLIDVPLPFVSGFSGAPINSGSVRNTGWEFELGYNTRIRDGLDLNFSGNLTTVNNELVSLAPGIDEYTVSDVYRTATGFPIGYFYGYQTCGIYQTDAAAQAAPVDRTIGNSMEHRSAGDVCFQDVNEDGEITPADRTFLGSSIPDLYYGFNVNAIYNRLDVGFFFTGVGGVQKYNAVRRQLGTVSGGGDNRLVEVLDRWTPENPSNTVPRAIATDPNNNGRFSDRWVEDADYLRLRNVQIGYTLPDGLLGTTGTRVYVSGTNLFTLTDYSGLDPEFTTSVDFTRSQNARQVEAGTDFGNLPQPRTFQIGVTTSF